MDSQPISYRLLPHKGQLLILMLARFTEPLATSSIHSYMFFQLKYFDPTASNTTISTQIGLMIGSKTAAHVCMGLLWGRLADHARVGRKSILLIGLVATSIATLGYGFSKTFRAAIAWQVLDGALNATIAMVRCMTSELNPEKRHRVRALTLLPLFANIGSLLGPLIGGFLAFPNTSPGSKQHSRYPYAAPNICIAAIQTFVALTAVFFLNDTLNQGKQPVVVRDHVISQSLDQRTAEEFDECSPLLANSSAEVSQSRLPPLTPSNLSFRNMWTPNVISTMVAQFIISGHLGTFASLWAIFLSIPVGSPQNQHPPVHFSGGVGMQPHSIGIIMSAFGFAGIIIQILVYPSVQERWGTIKVWRSALCVFPFVYILAPFCALIASQYTGGHAEEHRNSTSSTSLWATLLVILVLFAAGRTGVVPATTLLINDCTPHPSVRGTIHTTGVIVSNLSRSIFPPMAFAVLGYGLKIGMIGLGFWFVAGLAVLSCLASLRVNEGKNGEEECA